MNSLIAYIIFGLLIIALVSVLINMYNRLVMLKFNVSKSFANIDVLLKQRADEIPNLVSVVKEFMRYESETLAKITQLRTQFLNANDDEDKIDLSNQMSRSLKSIFAVSENYPDLKSNEHFLALQHRVSGIEDAIADRREFYNESVNMYNIGIHEFPDLILAGLMRYKEKKLLEITVPEKAYDGIEF